MNAPNTPYRPLLTDAARPSTFAVASIDEHGETREVPVAGEHPLTLYVDKQELLTLMTLGAAPEALAIGYLRNQRLVDSIDDILAVQVDWECNACAIKTRHGLADLEAKTAKKTKTTGCGQGTMFGDLMEEIDNVRLPDGATLTQAALYALLDQVRVHETIYKQAGAVHGCALATNDGDTSRILMFVEDVGRHNAVDAIAGRMWLDRLDGADKIFYTTGRLTSEMVIKAAQMGIPFLVSRSGLTQMGFEIAQKVGITMIGRATNKHYLLFTGTQRFVRPAATTRCFPCSAVRGEHPNTAAASAHGRCHCGQVEFVATFPSRFCAHCHCESCRRAHGAAFVTWIGFPSELVKVTRGAELLAAHESSPQTFRKFCRHCGSKLFFESARWAGETHVVLTAFDQPVDRLPTSHAFFEEHVAWLPQLPPP